MDKIQNFTLCTYNLLSHVFFIFYADHIGRFTFLDSLRMRILTLFFAVSSFPSLPMLS